MTTIVLQGFSVASNSVFSAISGFFGSVTAAIQLSRQVKANEQIAGYLLKEYPDHTYQSLLAELNYKTIQNGIVK
tara:strand:+ start:293 stop:517 length:225 start_codon:yes stop_codon:yes gene_type:complete